MAWGQTYAFHYFNSEDDKDTRNGKKTDVREHRSITIS